MKKMRWPALLSLLLLPPAPPAECRAAAAPAPTGETAPPNIVFILLDNVGQEWFGCYGSEENCTPHIDRLACAGVRVEHCYTPPVCGPSRTMLLTGRYPHSTGFRLHHDAALYSGGGLDPRREILFPRLFRDAGYATGIAGKWQMNNLYDEPAVLAEHGFDEHLVWPGSLDSDQVQPRRAWPRFGTRCGASRLRKPSRFIQHIESRYWDPVFLRNGRREECPGKFGPDVAQEFAFDFLRRHRDQPLPLLLPDGPHPWPHLHRAGCAHAARPRLRTDRTSEMFADMLRYADRLIGDFVAELDRLGLRENTIVFVASDNGTEKSFRARRNGREVTGGLYTLTEAGGDVVLLANNPRRIPRRAHPATGRLHRPLPHPLRTRRGAPCPRAPSRRPVLRPLSPRRTGAAPPRDWILNAYHEPRVVRDTQFKLYSDGRFFDVTNDPEEQHPLASEITSAAAAARTRLEAVLAALPPDAPAPFPLRSQSGFKIRTDLRAAGPRRRDSPTAIRVNSQGRPASEKS